QNGGHGDHGLEYLSSGNHGAVRRRMGLRGTHHLGDHTPNGRRGGKSHRIPGSVYGQVSLRSGEGTEKGRRKEYLDLRRSGYRQTADGGGSDRRLSCFH